MGSAVVFVALDSMDEPAGLRAGTVAGRNQSTHQSTHQCTFGPAADALAWRARDLIGQQLEDTALSPTRLASQVHVSLRRLQEVFQSQGTTLIDCIWQARLEFARSMLCNCEHRQESISTVAYRAGFTDVAHFSRRFKQAFGMSPRQYRETAA